jgi:hypothetical protein
MGAVIWWTGATTICVIGFAVGWFLSVAAKLAFIAAWHTARVYRHGWLRDPDRTLAISLSYPPRLWWYFFTECPAWYQRKDGKGGKICRPFSAPMPERYPG